MKYILILGGTGAMGKHLVSILRKDSGNHIYVTSRQKRKDENNVSYIFGNAHNNEFIFLGGGEQFKDFILPNRYTQILYIKK